ncbi:MDR family MFS transporter [Clostridium estertheticum]|uniref:MDR family MFS transporter n=1 Tax=Clostridium estertheticum TaxID=238834 RepID=UPI001C0CF344|nr:MDR family MFS transporter [Clostridium estertheticum]MBU3075756.1 MFS transporter [Clostridium estertheticum]MBU3165756.1 MFS transporter [Clostridium estertheticum]
MKSKNRGIVIALMVAMFLAAVEGTVVTTAIPTIVKDLNGFELISWVFSAYLLTSAISTPIYGKLSDLYGRKNVLSIGIAIFIVGSCLCGISQSMYQLIASRGIQGLGAGAIFTITYTIVGDIFTAKESTRIQGGISTVWGIASLAGPFLGGFLIENISWNWIFFINLPFGIISIVLLQKNLIETVERKKHKIDYVGTLLFSFAIITFLLGSLSGGKMKTVISIAVTIVLLVLFYYVEKNAEEPIIPFDIFTKTSNIVNAISFLASGILIGAEVYMPLYMQNVLGFGPTISGISMAPMSISWLLSSFVLSKAIPKYGKKIVVGTANLILIISCVVLSTLSIESPLQLVVVYGFIMGFGFGGAFTTLTIVVQESVGYNKRGAATAVNSLVRTLGQTIAVSIFGTILNMHIVKYFNNLGISGIKPSNLYSSSISSNSLSMLQVKLSLNSGLHEVFIAMIIIAIVSLALSFMFDAKSRKNLCKV